jgi:hypothetical protein
MTHTHIHTHIQKHSHMHSHKTYFTPHPSTHTHTHMHTHKNISLPPCTHTHTHTRHILFSFLTHAHTYHTVFTHINWHAHTIVNYFHTCSLFNHHHPPPHTHKAHIGIHTKAGVSICVQNNRASVWFHTYINKHARTDPCTPGPTHARTHAHTQTD